MATLTKYTYSVTANITSHVVDSRRLIQEYEQSSIATALSTIEQAGDVLDIWTKNTLSGGDETTLNALVQAHSGEPLPVNTLTKVQLFSSEANPAPVASDGKPYTIPNCFPGEVVLNFTGCSDKITAPTSRFGGALFGMSKTGVGTETFTMDFLDGLYLAGGGISWEGGGYGSYVYFELAAPATTTKAPLVANQGNCNKVDTGFGFNIIVPAAGDGVFDIDAAVPIPANDDETNAPNGYWEYSEPWVGKGVVSAGIPAHGKYSLYDAPLELAHFVKVQTHLDTGIRNLVAPAIKPKWILPEWKMVVSIYNADANKTLKVTWDMMIARRKTT
jgi:hypothetical protein